MIYRNDIALSAVTVIYLENRRSRSINIHAQTVTQSMAWLSEWVSEWASESAWVSDWLSYWVTEWLSETAFLWHGTYRSM